MPLPQSRIGRVILLGIVLGVLVVFAAAAFASVAHAQEAPAPANAVCRAADLYATFSDVKDEGLRHNINSLQVRLRDQCAQSPETERIRSGDAIGWINYVDATINDLMMSMGDRMSRPISAADRKVLQELMFRTVDFQRDFELIRLDAYKAVRTETKEVVKTVEVPAQCPEPRAVEPPPPPRDPCADALRQGAARWASQLYKWTGWYRGSGADWALADSSKSDLSDIGRGFGDPRAYIVGWLAQWRSIRRDDNTSFLGSGPMPQIAADMRAQLQYCGVYQEGDR